MSERESRSWKSYTFPIFTLIVVKRSEWTIRNWCAMNSFRLVQPLPLRLSLSLYLHLCCRLITRANSLPFAASRVQFCVSKNVSSFLPVHSHKCGHATGPFKLLYNFDCIDAWLDHFVCFELLFELRYTIEWIGNDIKYESSRWIPFLFGFWSACAVLWHCMVIKSYIWVEWSIRNVKRQWNLLSRFVLPTHHTHYVGHWNWYMVRAPPLDLVLVSEFRLYNTRLETNREKDS